MNTLAHRQWKSHLVHELVGQYGTQSRINVLESIVRDDLSINTADVIVSGTYRLRVRSLVDAADRACRLAALIEHLRRHYGNRLSPPPSPGQTSAGGERVSPRTLAIECDRERQWLEVEPFLADGFGTILVPGPSGEAHNYFLDRVAAAVETSVKLQLGDYDLSSDHERLHMLAATLGLPAGSDREAVVDRLAAMTADGITTLVGSKEYHDDYRDALHAFYVDFVPQLLLEVRARAGIHGEREGRGVLFVNAVVRESSWLPSFMLSAPRFLRALRATFLRRWHADSLHFHVARELSRITDAEALSHLASHAIPIGKELKERLSGFSASKAILEVIEHAARCHQEAVEGGGR